jgi:DNA-binding transcriptional regulator YiaG
MNTITSYQSAWFKPIFSTGASRVIVTIATAATLVSTATTGGSNDLISVKDRFLNEHNYGTQLTQSKAGEETRSTIACLLRIREFFTPSVSDLAATLGVSRQTVYNWQDGEQPKDALAVKLSDLAIAADVLAQANIQFTGAIARRKFADGKTLFQVVESNNSASEAARMLVRIIETEAKQRKVMEARMINRSTKTQTSDFDLPMANDPT